MSVVETGVKMNSSVKQAIRNGKVTIGSWITFPSPTVAEIMAQAGFDWLTIDLEHSPIGMESVHHLIQVIDLCGCVPMVRLPSHDPVYIKRVMDAGARGVIIPSVSTPGDALRVKDNVKYPPLGKRGMGLARAQGYGERFLEYVEEINQEAIIIAMIEDRTGVENIKAILQIKDLDGVLIGPYDLSGSLGVPGQFDHTLMKEAEEKVLHASKEEGVAAGFHVIHPSIDDVKRKIERGYTFIPYSADMILLGRTCRSSVEELRHLLRIK